MPIQPFSAVLVGDESLLVRCGEMLLSRDHRVDAIVTQSAYVRAFAEAHDIRCLANADELLGGTFPEFDFLFSIANLRILPKDVIALPRSLAINFHDGPLPEYAGLHTTTWAIADGRDTHAVTWHVMDERVDTGPIVSERTIALDNDESAFSLNTRCYEAGIASFGELVAAIETGTLRPRQQSGVRTLFRRDHRPPTAGLLLPSITADAQEHLVRALHFGPYDNPIGLPRLPVHDPLYVVAASIGRSENGVSESPPGTLLAIDDERAVVATVAGQIVYERIIDLDGREQPAGHALGSIGLREGDSIVQLSEKDIAGFVELDGIAIRNEHACLTQLENPCAVPLDRVVPGAGTSTGLRHVQAQSAADLAQLQRAINGSGQTSSTDEVGAAAVAIFLSKLSHETVIDLKVTIGTARGAPGAPDFFTSVPIRFSLQQRDAPVSDLFRRAAMTMGTINKPSVLRRDVSVRREGVADLDGAAFPVWLIVGASNEPDKHAEHNGLLVHVADGKVQWKLSAGVEAAGQPLRLARLFDSFVDLILASPDAALASLSLCPPDEQGPVSGESIEDASATFLLHEAVERGVGDDPDRLVASWSGGELSAGELVRTSDAVAQTLGAMGVGAGHRVGVCVERSGDMLSAVLGILKSGAAYVPIDAALPAARRRRIEEDAGIRVVVCSPSLTDLFNNADQSLVDPTGIEHPRQTVAGVAAAQPHSPPTSRSTPDDPAYVIYTSGSTGEPKGVVVRHRNVGNFFVGMDRAIGSDGPGRWLAVTSLAFDISVLELFWTLARGFDVVIHSPAETGGRVLDRATSAPVSISRGVDFSLFFFSSSETTKPGSSAYRLLLDAATFADENGFEAVWTPERHFHAFGGLFPNPAVVGAALAARTNRIQIRAGSCVSPLHHPVRIAEEWSVVDNLSDGRVGVAFAAGWQPHDFVLMPENYADRKRIMYDQVAAVKALWRGEAVSFEGHDGEPVAVNTLPRPVQPELPVWITAAGNPDTFRKAGEAGYNVLTHLLGQSIAELGEKIAAYRAGREAAGHEGSGAVSAMIHTFVHPDANYAEKTVREPLKAYLRSAIGLVQDAAWSFPTFKEKTIDESGRFTLDNLSPEDVDAILDHAFERYYRSSGLFGTPDDCVETVAKLVDVGVTDIACLIDFGIDAGTVLDGLTHLASLQDQVQQLVSVEATLGDRKTPVGAGTSAAVNGAGAAGADASVSRAIVTNDITHLQCTPSLARLIIEEEESRLALAQLEKMLVGGEELPPALAHTLRESVRGDLYNMYGPTETTIWSTVDLIGQREDPVTIGRPIANTELYLVDMDGQMVPRGYSGELLIGGASVAAGYLNRDEQTRTRFFADPFGDSGVVYATGDRCRLTNDGRIVFLGRSDGQVKINGYRVELGSIERALESLDGVAHAAARVGERSAAKVVEAYVVARKGSSLSDIQIREAVKTLLPAYAVPSSIVVVDYLPLTVNGKVDRSRLASHKPDRGQSGVTGSRPPRTGAQTRIADMLADLLQRDSVGLDDNFFDIGGHSLLAVQVIAQLSADFGREVSLVDFFRYPTVRSLSEYLETDTSAAPSRALTTGTSRADARRAAIQRRSR